MQYRGATAVVLFVASTWMDVYRSMARAFGFHWCTDLAATLLFLIPLEYLHIEWVRALNWQPHCPEAPRFHGVIILRRKRGPRHCCCCYRRLLSHQLLSR